MDLVVAGFGCAGYYGVKAMREAGHEGKIHIFTSDEAVANPMLTTYYTAGKLAREEMFPLGTVAEAVERYQLTLHSEQVSSVDYLNHTITGEKGACCSFDRLLIATGASALVPPFPGANSSGVFTMRTPADSDALLKRLEKGSVTRAVIIGASMVGIKVVELLHKRGIECVLADLAPRIFPVASLPESAGEIESRLKKKGIALKFGRGIEAIDTGDDGSLNARFSGGESEACDLVVLCIGTRANTGLAGESLQVNRGIVVDDHMQTSIPFVYAAGDCCEGRNRMSGETQIIGLWANAAAQGKTAGRNMAGVSTVYDGNIPHNITHFFDMDFIAFGDNRIQGTPFCFRSGDGRTQLQTVFCNGRMSCLNLLDNYGISGILKHFFLKRIEQPELSFGMTERAKLKKYGLPEWVITGIEQMDAATANNSRR
ncbi:MAG: NAD(P)/FAD-dependent oxidoreductase [Lachnospiraceae bacterium]